GTVGLADHISRGVGGAEPAINLEMVVVDVGAELLRVRPVDLAVRREVVAGISLEGTSLVGVSQVEELPPVLDLELLLPGWDRGVVGNRPVAREHAPTEKAPRRGLGRILEVAVEEAVGDPACEGGPDRVHVVQLDHTLDLPPWRQAEPHRGDHAEEAVATDGEPEELGVRAAVAGDAVPAGVD